MPEFILSPDDDIRNADWPKRTPDKISDLRGPTLYNPTPEEFGKYSKQIADGKIDVVRDDSGRTGLSR
jgi:hypothetical protein